jgi:hypothetical protein
MNDIIENGDGNSRQSTKYVWKSATVTADGVLAETDLTTVSGFTTILSTFATTKTRMPRYIKMWASAAAYLKVNGGDIITLGATTPFEADDLAIQTIYISTGGAGVTITIQLQ